LWFEEGSPFLARLSAELSDIPHKIKPLLWSGANSIFVRDKTGHALADHLSAEHADHPQASQLIIAHSHGGNIALRALHHLQKREATQLSGADNGNPLVVTLATPFVEVHQADSGRRPLYIRLALMLLVVTPLIMSLPLLLFDDVTRALVIRLVPLSEIPDFSEGRVILLLIANLVGLYILLHIGSWWIVRRAPARQNKLDALNSATRLGELVSAQPLLVIRAVDDEASLTIALGAIINHLTAGFITYVLLLYLVFPLVLMPLVLMPMQWTMAVMQWTIVALVAGGVGLTTILFVLLMISRAVYGRELAVSPMECQINTQSTPDAEGLSKIVTLVRRTYIKSLRHGIYDHEDCAKTIADWVRSQLCMGGNAALRSRSGRSGH
jgi:hypothetical protein